MVVMKKENMVQWIGKRKYCSQMSMEETDGLFKRLKAVEENGYRWRMSGHTLDRLKGKGINADYNDIVSAIHNAEIVEYKIDKNKFSGEPEERVVIKANAVVNRCYNLKAVYSLTERRIVTVWVNHVKDTHATLDWSIYDETMPVFGV